MSDVTVDRKRAPKGMSLEELAAELTRQKEAKRDFVANTTDLRVLPDEDSATKLSLQVGHTGDDIFPVRQHAVRQIGSRLGIPAKYVDRLAENHPDMLAWNINKLFEREPENRMVRVLDDNCRAFLSDKFRPLDNFDFANAALPKLIEQNADILSCTVTETRMYIKAIIPDVVREIKAPGVFFGDGGHNEIHILRPGCCMSNSEVGAGSMAFQPGIHEKHCSNLAIFNKNAMKKYHVGARQATDQEGLWEVFTDATRQASNEAFWMQVQDLVKASLEGELFEQLVTQCEAAITGTQIVKPTMAVKELKDLSDTEQEGVLNHLIKGGELSQWGMQAAITRFAQESDIDYTRQVELEQMGGNIIELPTNQWERIAEAA